MIGIENNTANELIHELMLLETDEIKLNMFNNSLRVKMVECESILHDLRILSLLKNDFLRIKTSNGKEIIVNNLNGSIILPKCLKLSDIELVFAGDDCYEDPELHIASSNGNFTGFLRKDNILVKESKKIDCRNRINYRSFNREPEIDVIIS
jgi:hypothetical protein